MSSSKESPTYRYTQPLRSARTAVALVSLYERQSVTLVFVDTSHAVLPLVGAQCLTDLSERRYHHLVLHIV